jgi:hypothetical protein
MILKLVKSHQPHGANKTKRQTKLLKANQTFSKGILTLFMTVFATLGSFFLLSSLAAPNPNLHGDLNNDNTVNGLDLSLLVSNYATSHAAADVDGNGTVNIIDLSILLSQFGQTYNPGGSGTTRDVFPGQSITAAINASAAGDTVKLHAGNYPALNLTKSFSITNPLNIVGESGVVIAGITLPNVSGYDISSITSSIPDDRNCCNASAFYISGTTHNITLSNSTLSGGFVTLKFYSGSDNEANWAHDIYVHDNDIHGTGGDLIHVDCLKDSIFEHNFIHDPGAYFAASDEHHDGIQDQSSDNLQIIRNTFKADAVTPGQAQGTGQAMLLQSEEAFPNRFVTNTLVANNLVYDWNFGLSVQILEGNVGTKFVNNTVYAGGLDGTSLTISSGPMTSSNTQIWNNILDSSFLNDGGSEISFYDTNWFRVQARNGMSGSHFSTGDPKFVDTTGGFALKPTSPAKNLGLTRTGTPTTDIDAATRPTPPELGARL